MTFLVVFVLVGPYWEYWVTKSEFACYLVGGILLILKKKVVWCVVLKVVRC